MSGREWRYGLLTPSGAVGSEAANAPWLGPLTLGVEVTELALAVRCGLGNLDPQHGGGGAGRSAIEAALTWPVPPVGAQLVTLRPDADAFGAMAVLGLRLREHPLNAVARERVVQISACDAFEFGPWDAWIAGRGPLSRPADIDEVSHLPEEYRALSAMAMDGGRSVGDRVGAMERWLVHGEIDGASRDAARTFAARLAEAWNKRTIDVRHGAHPSLAVVRAASPAGLQLGYRLAPVVLAEGGEGDSRRLTVAQFDPGRLDLVKLKARLAALEPGWSGSPSLIASPQGVGARLSLAEVEGAVCEALSA